MEHSDFLLSTLSFFGLLGIATLIKPLAKKIRIPFAVGLLAAGIAISALIRYGDFHFAHLQFSPELVFYVFLPSLIFESAYHLNFRHFRRVLPESLILATVGIAISMSVTAILLHLLLNLPWGASWLFGAFISATDPVAVLAVFKELKAPHKLSTIVDGESLINDGTSLVAFHLLFKTVVLGGAVVMGPKMLLIQGFGAAQNILLGVIVGLIMGWIFSLAIPRMQSRGAQLTLSLILAHVTFLLAEGILGVSGILATMTAGIIMGNFGRRKLDKKAKQSFSEVWKFLEFVSNALVFLLLGTRLGQSDFFMHWKYILVAIIVTVFIARPAAVFPSFAISNAFRQKADKCPFSYQLITTWGGIRGALAAAAVLLIPDSFEWAAEFQAMTAGVIIATFLLKATTIPFWLKKFNLLRLNVSERIQRIEAQLLIGERVTEHLHDMRKRKYISDEILKKLTTRYKSQQDNAERELDALQSKTPQNARELEKSLTHFALGIEMKKYRRLFELGELSEKRLAVLEGSILRQFDRLDQDILPSEFSGTNSYAPNIPKSCLYSFSVFKDAWKTYRNRQISGRWQHYRARKIASWSVLLDFKNLKKAHPLFQDSAIVTEILKRYKQWNDNSEKKMLHLQNQFPSIIDPLRLRVAEANCLKHEAILEQEFLEKGLICEKVFENLDEDIRRRKDQCHVCNLPNFFT